jgi:hypothetical protein
MRSPRIFRRVSAGDLFFASVIGGLALMTARIWWISTIVPGMDYPQFLVFVRVVQDHADPSSPFYGTYSVAPWFVPTSLPVNVVSWLSYALGHSIEAAGKAMLTLQNLGLVAATVYLLKVLERPRWAALLVLPLVHTSWTAVAGFLAYATSFPILVLGWALTVRWLKRLDLRSGIALAVCFWAMVLWHGLGFAQLGFDFALLWLLWRAPSLRARLIGVLPTIPSLLSFAVWQATTFRSGGLRRPPEWRPFWEVIDGVFDDAWACVPHYPQLVAGLACIVVLGLLICRTNVGAAARTTRMWRVENPFLVIAIAHVVLFLVGPDYMNHVEGIRTRFTYTAMLAFVFAWNLPGRPVARGLVLAAIYGFTVWCLDDLTERFHAFDAETRGASALMDRVGLHETFYYVPADQGASSLFAGPANRPTRELEQFATVRHGGLPRSSFAGYGYTYVRYADGNNPMPDIEESTPPWSQDMTRYDWVMTRNGSGLSDPRFKLIEKREGWTLYGVCGSARFPRCD